MTMTMTNMKMTRSALFISVVVSLSLCTPTFGFHIEPNISSNHAMPQTNQNSLAAQPLGSRHFRPSLTSISRSTTTTRRLLSSNDDLSNRNSREEEMMDQAVLMEQELLRIQNDSAQSVPVVSATPQRRIDPLIASLTRIDEPTPNNVPMVKVPLFGEIPADGTLGLLAPAAAIGILGFIFSIVVAINSRDSIVQGLSSVELPKMEYTPTVVEEGKCRGLCSSQAEDLDGLRNFMESISRK